jgi:hypothetical protein
MFPFTRMVFPAGPEWPDLGKLDLLCQEGVDAAKDGVFKQCTAHTSNNRLKSTAK